MLKQYNSAILNKEKHFSLTLTLYSTISKDININQLRVGLIQTDTVKPSVLRKRTSIINKCPCKIEKITEFRPVYLQFIKKRSEEIEQRV